MPKTEEQYQEIRDQKRKLIMEAALELFAEKGFATTSINLIAKKAGISKGLIYNYFESKDELITTIINIGFEDFLSIIDLNRVTPLTDEEFVNYINQTINLLKTNLHFYKLYFQIMGQPEVLKLVENKLMELIMPFMIMMSTYFETKGHENPMAYSRFFGAMLDGVFLNYVVDPDNFPIDEVKDIIIKKFI